MNRSHASPAARAAADPSTGFQAISRDAGIVLSAGIPVSSAILPIVEQALTVLDAVPEAQRRHECWDGSWSSVWIVRPAGASAAELSLGSRLPALALLFAELGARPSLVVIARIAPHDLLDWHYDPVSIDHEEARLHLPIRTHPAAVTELCHERVHWPVGGLYYGDYGFPHRVFNTSAEERIHLYFDVPAGVVRERLPPAVVSGDGRTRCRIRETAVAQMLAERHADAVTAAV